MPCPNCDLTPGGLSRSVLVDPRGGHSGGQNRGSARGRCASLSEPHSGHTQGRSYGSMRRRNATPVAPNGVEPGQALAPMLVDVRTAAQLMACSRSFLYELIAAGQLPTVKLGRSRRIPVDELRRYIAENAHLFVRAA